MKFNIFVDESIAFPEAFELFGNVIKFDGRKITNDALKNADFLIIRSVTKIDEKLLDKTNIKFIGSTTSGSDHIDTNYLDHRGIFFADAKGCNSFAVAEYVLTAIVKLLNDGKKEFSNIKIGIIGYGNIGTIVAKFCSTLGMSVKINDPPLQKKNNNDITFHPLEDILQCDIISLHVPLTFDGQYKTYKLLDENLSLIRENSILINTSRGGVVNEQKLLKIITEKKLNVVTDVWCDEPNINIELLEKSKLSTPHIAGHSFEGKVNGTKIIFEQLNRFLGTKKNFDFNASKFEKTNLIFNEKLNPKNLNFLLKQIYDIKNDSQKIKKIISLKFEQRSRCFDYLRKSYIPRKSFKDFIIATSNNFSKEKFENLRFLVEIT